MTQLVRHIRDADALADDSAVALALLIEENPDSAPLLAEFVGDLAPPSSDADRARAAADAARELRRYVTETPTPLSSAVWAVGKTHDTTLADTFASILTRALDRGAEPLAYQALVALTALPDDAVPVDTIRLAAAKGHDEVRELANDWLDFSG